MGMKLILSGDLHLGRTSTRVPESWRDRARSLYGWERLVEATVRAKADVLLLSGDVIDAANRFWETSGPFEAGIQTLHEAGVEVVAIAGNHDAMVLPAVAKGQRSAHLKVLGSGGQWERITLEKEGMPLLHVDGWSFPSETVFEDPLASYSPPPQDGLPVLGMVHGDPGVPDSRYAPLSLPALHAAPVEGWLLGHIHKPSFEAGPPWILMPGSLHPLDPGEPGAHHAWSCEVADGKLSVPQPFCPASLRYEEVNLGLTPDERPSVDRLLQRIRGEVDRYRVEGHLVLRLIFTGTTRQPDLLEASLEGIQELTGTSGWSIDRVESRVHPDLNPEELAQNGPVQALLVRALEEGGLTLQSRLQAVLDPVLHHPVFSGKDLPPVSSEDLPLSHTLETLLRHSLPTTPES